MRFCSRDGKLGVPPTIPLQYNPLILHRYTLEYSCQFSKQNCKSYPKKNLRKLTFKSKKTGCKATIQVKEVSIFGKFNIESPQFKSQRVQCSAKVRDQIDSSSPSDQVHKKFFMRICLSHTTHPRHNFVGSTNRIHPDKARQLQHMAMTGIRSVAVARMVLGYTDPTKEQTTGNRHHPTNRTIVNHLGIGARRKRNSPNDQTDLLLLVIYFESFVFILNLPERYSGRTLYLYF